MKTVVITGSARGFGYAMLEEFKRKNYNVVICDINDASIKDAYDKLSKVSGTGKVLSFKADITNEIDVDSLISYVLRETGKFDIWINNAGVNGSNKPIWEEDMDTINRLIDIDLKGTIMCSKKIVPVMQNNGGGSIYNVEGYGSNNAVMTGLSIYGTAKRAVTYFTEALAHECKELAPNVKVGKITPGIMITNFINTSLGDGKKFEIPEKTKKVYNILGDYPDVIAKFMVEKIDKNTKNNVKFTWLTNRKAAWRFLSFSFNKREFFKD